MMRKNKIKLKREPKLLNDGTIEIRLTKGQVTRIDAKHADLAQLNWTAVFRPSYADGGRFSASREIRDNEGKWRTQHLHRAILSRMLGRDLLPDEEVDHIDRNPLNNLEGNLRLATHGQNAMNHSVRKDSKSGLKGVDFMKGKWRAQIRMNGKPKHLGLFNTPDEAYRAYCETAKKLHGEFANLGEKRNGKL